MASGSKKREGSHSAGANRGPWFAAVPPTGAPASQIWRGRGVSPTLGIPYGRGCPGVGGPGGRDRGGGRRCALRISIPMPCGDGDSISPECSSLSCALNAAHPATNPAGILLLIRSSSAPLSPYNRMQMQLSSEAQIPDGMLAAIALRNEKPRLGVPSWNPALHQGIDASNSTIVLGLQSTAALNRIGSRSTGKERDAETGLDYFGARYMSSNMGRFMSPDPGNIGADPKNPQSWNMYSYVVNNPLKFTDPTGLYCYWGKGNGKDDDDPQDGGASQSDCLNQGGYWTDRSNPCRGADNCSSFTRNDPAPMDMSQFWGYLEDWRAGTLPNFITYLQNDGWTANLRKSPGVNDGIDRYVEGGCVDREDLGTHGKLTGATFNMAQAETGNFKMSSSTSGNTVTFTVTNTSGQTSFSGANDSGSGSGYWPLNIDGTKANPYGSKVGNPRHDVFQTFIWSEPRPCTIGAAQ